MSFLVALSLSLLRIWERLSSTFFSNLLILFSMISMSSCEAIPSTFTEVCAYSAVFEVFLFLIDDCCRNVRNCFSIVASFSSAFFDSLMTLFIDSELNLSSSPTRLVIRSLLTSKLVQRVFVAVTSFRIVYNSLRNLLSLTLPLTYSSSFCTCFLISSVFIFLSCWSSFFCRSFMISTISDISLNF